MADDFPNVPGVKSVSELEANYSGTISNRSIPLYYTPPGGTDVSILKTHADAVASLLKYCFAQDPPAPLRALGSAWSFSRVVEPGRVVVDPANMTFVERVPAKLFAPGYAARAAQGYVPIFAEGGTQIASLNRRLASDLRLALQTSGAGDGHRLAGCIATGTHGSALGIGALHDTVQGLLLMVAPDRLVFLQPATDPFATQGIAGWLAQQTGHAVESLQDDDAFHAALVSLGSFGFVLGVVVEAVPLYRLKFQRFARPWNDATVWNAIETFDLSPLCPGVADRPYHFDVVMHPYPPGGGDPGLFVTLMWKTSADGVPATSPLPVVPLGSSDLMGFVGRLTKALDGRLTEPLALPILRAFISQELVANGSPAAGEAFPGEMFGPTSLPAGTGASTEIAVDQKQARQALEVIYKVLDQRQQQGHFLLGCLGVRFVPQTRALLGMNAAAMNCYIELPSIRNNDVLGIYQAIWDALEQANIPFTCHWGQLGGMNPARLARYFGDRAVRWRAYRAQLLGPVGSRVFGAPILGDVGLGP